MERFLVKQPHSRNEALEAQRAQEKKRKLDVITEANLKIFHHQSFRPHQAEIVTTVLENKDAFVIMPTGGGKSLCYALPAVLSKGVTVVISPLISLIEDQVSALINLGIPAAFLTSTCNEGQKKIVFQGEINNRFHFTIFILLFAYRFEPIGQRAVSMHVHIELMQS